MGDDRRNSATNVQILQRDEWCLRDLIIWLNEEMKCKVHKIEELRTGAIYCQLLHRLFPFAIQMKNVKLYTRRDADFQSNFELLSEGFKKVRVTYEMQIDQLVNGVGHLEFLNWYHKFYEANVTRIQRYKPRLERNNSKIGLKPTRPRKHHKEAAATENTETSRFNFENGFRRLMEKPGDESAADWNDEVAESEGAQKPVMNFMELAAERAKKGFCFVKHCTLFDELKEAAGKNNLNKDDSMDGETQHDDANNFEDDSKNTLAVSSGKVQNTDVEKAMDNKYKNNYNDNVSKAKSIYDTDALDNKDINKESIDINDALDTKNDKSKITNMRDALDKRENTTTDIIASNSKITDTINLNKEDSSKADGDRKGVIIKDSGKSIADDNDVVKTGKSKESVLLLKNDITKTCETKDDAKQVVVENREIISQDVPKKYASEDNSIISKEINIVGDFAKHTTTKYLLNEGNNSEELMNEMGKNNKLALKQNDSEKSSTNDDKEVKDGNDEYRDVNVPSVNDVLEEKESVAGGGKNKNDKAERLDIWGLQSPSFYIYKEVKTILPKYKGVKEEARIANDNIGNKLNNREANIKINTKQEQKLNEKVQTKGIEKSEFFFDYKDTDRKTEADQLKEANNVNNTNISADEKAAGDSTMNVGMNYITKKNVACHKEASIGDTITMDMAGDCNLQDLDMIKNVNDENKGAIGDSSVITVQNRLLQEEKNKKGNDDAVIMGKTCASEKNTELTDESPEKNDRDLNEIEQINVRNESSLGDPIMTSSPRVAKQSHRNMDEQMIKDDSFDEIPMSKNIAATSNNDVMNNEDYVGDATNSVKFQDDIDIENLNLGDPNKNEATINTEAGQKGAEDMPSGNDDSEDDDGAHCLEYYQDKAKNNEIKKAQGEKRKQSAQMISKLREKNVHYQKMINRIFEVVVEEKEDGKSQILELRDLFDKLYED